MRMATGIETFAYSNLLSVSGTAGINLPTATPATMQSATHSVKYRPNTPISSATLFLSKPLFFSFFDYPCILLLQANLKFSLVYFFKYKFLVFLYVFTCESIIQITFITFTVFYAYRNSLKNFFRMTP